MKEGWKYVKLGDVCKIYNGNSINADYKKKHYEDLKEGYPFIATKDVSFIGAINYDNGVKIPYNNELKKAFPGSVFICAEGGSAGRKIAYIEKEVCFGNKLFCLKPKMQNLLGKYVYYYLNSEFFQYQFKEKLTGLIGGVSATKFNDITICIGDIDDQHRIVSYLDTSFAQIDALAKQAEESLENAKALFQATLKKMMEPKEGWEKKKFGKICDFIRGPFGGSLKKDCFKDAGFAVYEQQNAIYNRFDFRYFIDSEKYNSMIRFKVNPGDLIMSCSGTIGKVAIVPEYAKEGIINQALLKLTPHKEIHAQFLKYLMESEYFKEIISSYSDGAAIKNIAAVAVLKNIVLSVPSLTKQETIVATLDSLSEKVTQLQSNYTQTLANCQALKQALLRETFE